MKRTKGPLISIVIPVYNSSASVVELSDRLARVFAATGDGGYELILVDDGSSNPGTWPALEELAGKNSRVRAVRLTRNFGQNAAVLCGLGEARGEYIVTMDDDLQHSPEDIPLLLAKKDHDVVMAQFPVKKHHVIRRMLSGLKGIFDRIIIGIPKGLSVTSFKLMNRTVVDGILSIKTAHPYLAALVFHVTGDVVGVSVPHHGRPAGKSGYGMVRLARLFSNLLINNSSLLLKAVGAMGLLMSAASFIMVVYLVFRRVTQEHVVEGWTSLMVAVFFIGGLVLFAIGVLGEYLVRIISGVESMPAYLVRKRTP